MDKYREIANVIIDIFEDLLEDKGVMIENDDREDESSAIIFGEDYVYLEDRIARYLEICDCQDIHFCKHKIGGESDD